jgi:hypothetical protein
MKYFQLNPEESGPGYPVKPTGYITVNDDQTKIYTWLWYDDITGETDLLHVNSSILWDKLINRPVFMSPDNQMAMIGVVHVVEITKEQYYSLFGVTVIPKEGVIARLKNWYAAKKYHKQHRLRKQAWADLDDHFPL